MLWYGYGAKFCLLRAGARDFDTPTVQSQARRGKRRAEAGREDAPGASMEVMEACAQIVPRAVQGFSSGRGKTMQERRFQLPVSAMKVVWPGQGAGDSVEG